MVDPELFRAGLPLVVQAPSAGTKKLMSFIRGVKAGYYIILDPPTHEGRPVQLNEGGECICRFISDGRVIGFRARLAAAVSKPFPMLFLNYPRSVETTTLRRTKRFPVDLEMTISDARLEGDVEDRPRGRVTNLSRGGCMVEWPARIETGLAHYLTVFLPEQGRIDDLEVEVKRGRTRGDVYELGLEFLDLLDPGCEQIKGFLNRLEMYRVRA